MTDFILDDGTVVDTGQQWEIVLYTDTFIGTIDALFPKTEKVILGFNLNIPATMTTGTDRRMNGSRWDIHWSSFKQGYEVGTIRRYKLVEPTRRLPPHSFT